MQNNSIHISVLILVFVLITANSPSLLDKEIKQETAKAPNSKQPNDFHHYEKSQLKMNFFPFTDSTPVR